MEVGNAPGARQGRGEGKPRMPLSSRVATQISWSPLSGLKGVRPSLHHQAPLSMSFSRQAYCFYCFPIYLP